jgi:hypothetical protein
MLTGPVGAQGSMCGAAASSDRREEMPTSIHARRSPAPTKIAAGC